MADEPLLLHSLSEHGELIFGALDAARPRRIVEIGSETGGFSKELLDWCERNGATLTTVEPFPTPELRRLAHEARHFELVEGRSPGALEDIEPADAYVIDGDHNHWTVLRELRAAYAGDRAPLAILHDVGWPCARRDQYYSPESVPPEGVHPHSYEKGRHPAQSELVDSGGFHGDFQFAVALEEGGERNGVLTAVDDFVAEHGGLEYRQVDPVFGVGFVFPASAQYAARVRELLDPWHGSDLAARMERNRLRLYTRVLELQDELRRMGLRAGRATLAYDDRVGYLEAENASLRLELARLRAARAAESAAGPS